MKIVSRFLRLPFCFLWGCSLILSSPLTYAQDIRIEGIVADPGNSDNSVVIINGEFLKKGDKIKKYRVLEVQSKSVAFLDEESGAKEWLSVEKAAAPKAEAVSREAESPSGLEEPEKPKSLKEKFQELLELPKKFMNRIWEVKALRDLALTSNAAVLYYNKKGRFPTQMAQLIRANLLASSYEDGDRGKYRIYLISPPNPQQFAVRADPVDPTAGLRFFYIGTDTVIREETGKQATAKSEPHDYTSL